MKKIQIKPIRILEDNYVWMILNHDNTHAIIIDPGEADPVLQALKEHGTKSITILVTHHHHDHSAGIEKLKKTYSCLVYGSDKSPLNTLTNKLHDDDHINVTGFPIIRVLSIPGHTLDHCAYVLDDAIFCGDTLFSSGCGRLFEGTVAMLHDSLIKLVSLGTKMKLYPGHEYTQSNIHFALTVEPNNQALINKKIWVDQQISQQLPSLPTTISEELATNPFLRLNRPTVVKAAEQWAGCSLTDEISILTALRQWKNK
jgi:hydroxyacylglutathione hydrolase